MQIRRAIVLLAPSGAIPAGAQPHWLVGNCARRPSASSACAQTHRLIHSSARRARPTAAAKPKSLAALAEAAATAKARKVETLPFLVSTSQAERILRRAAVQGVFKEDQVPLLLRITNDIVRRLPDFIRNHFDNSLVKCEKISSLYLPIWVVDAIVKVKAEGDSGKTEATLLFEHSRFPAHCWKAMDMLPLNAINEDFLHAIKEADPSKKDDPDYATHYERWEEETHMRKPPTQLNGEILKLDFKVSPLQLPELLKQHMPELSAKPPRVKADPISFGNPFNKRQVAMVVPFPKDLNELETDDSSTLRFDPESLQIDMLAAYPVMLPVHLAEYTWINMNREQKTLLTAMNGHDITGSAVARTDLDREWSIARIGGAPAQAKAVDMFPSVPFHTSDPVKQKAEGEEETEEEVHKRSLDALKNVILGKILSAAGALGAVGFNLMLKGTKLLQGADWEAVQEAERSAWRSRAKALAGGESVPKESPSCDHIDWASPRVQQYTAAWQNRKYIDGYRKYLDRRTFAASLEEADADAVADISVRGEKGTLSIKEDLIRVLRKRDSLMPEWLREEKAQRRP